MKKLKAPLYLIIITAVLAIAHLTQFIEIGKLIYEVIPCEQIEGNSAPCYVKYDLAVLWGLLSLILIGIVWLLIKYWKIRNED